MFKILDLFDNNNQRQHLGKKANFKMAKKWLKQAENAKNNTTFLYETQKVGKVKVVLFFRFKHFFLMSTI